MRYYIIKLMRFLCIASYLLSLTCLNAETSLRGNSQGGQAVAKAKYMLQKVAAERDVLQTKNLELQKQIEKTKKVVAKLKTSLKNSKKNIGFKNNTIDKYENQNLALQDRVKKYQQRTQKIVTKYKELVATLRIVEQEKSQALVDTSRLTQEILICATNNINLYDSGLEMIRQYNEKGVIEAFLQDEPVTGLKSVQIENLIEEYRHSIRQERYVGQNNGTLKSSSTSATNTN